MSILPWRKLLLIVLSVALLLSIAFAVFQTLVYHKKPDSPIVARIGQEIITVNEVNYMISRLPKHYVDMIEKDKSKFLHDLVVDEILYQEASKRGILEEEDVKRTVKEAEKKIAIAKLIKDEIDDKVEISDDDIYAYYEQHGDEFMEPERIRASHILLHDRDVAEEVLAKLKKGESFEDMAIEYSIDISASQGGDIGYFTRGQLVPEFERACASLEVNQISDVIHSPVGFHIIKVTDRISSKRIPLKQVRDRISEILERRKRKEMFDEFVEKLRDKTDVEVNPEVLK